MRHHICLLSGLLALCSLACAGPQAITFSASYPPLISLTQNQRIASLGFNSPNLRMGARLDLLFTRLLSADTTMTVIGANTVLEALTGYAFVTGAITDSLALLVGHAVDADVVLVGHLDHRYTEQYGEEKKFRMVESFRPSSGGTQIRLADEPYREPYIDQVVILTATIRALDVQTGREIGRDQSAGSDTLHIILPRQVENPPKGPVAVTRVTPLLMDNVTATLAQQLVEKFTWQTRRVTRYVERDVQGAQDGLNAMKNGHWEQARAFWEQAIREQPDHPSVWNNLAITYEQAGRMDDAHRAYDRALALRPDDQTIRRNKAGRW